MKWKPISNIHDEDDYIPRTNKAQSVVLYSKQLDDQHDFPGLPYALSNIVYAKLHCSNEHYSHYRVLKRPHV